MEVPTLCWDPGGEATALPLALLPPTRMHWLAKSGQLLLWEPTRAAFLPCQPTWISSILLPVKTAIWPQAPTFSHASWGFLMCPWCDWWLCLGLPKSQCHANSRLHLSQSTVPSTYHNLTSFPSCPAQALVTFFHADGQGLPMENLRDGSYKVRPNLGPLLHTSPGALRGLQAGSWLPPPSPLPCRGWRRSCAYTSAPPESASSSITWTNSSRYAAQLWGLIPELLSWAHQPAGLSAEVPGAEPVWPPERPLLLRGS